MSVLGRLLPFENKEIFMDVSQDPSSAQFQIWLAQMKRDHGLISDFEMGKVENSLQSQAKKAKTIYNPFTGEIRKVEI